MESVKNNPNFDLMLNITQKLAQIKPKILTCSIFLILEGGGVGSIEQKNLNVGVISEKARTNLKTRILTHFKLYDAEGVK